MPHPEHPYISPVTGEHPAEASIDRLAEDLKEIVDNAITVSGPVLRVEDCSDEPLRQVAVQESEGVYFIHHPQSIEISHGTTAKLESLMDQWFAHYPLDDTLAQRQHGVPTLITRLDGMINPHGRIGLCEFEDSPVGYQALLSELNPEAFSYVEALRDSLSQPLASVVHPEAGYTHVHDDDWLPPLDPHAESDGWAVIPRGRRIAPGFHKFIERWNTNSIIAGRTCDHKGPLIPMQHGVLTEGPAVALELADRLWRHQSVVLKALHSSRSEAMAVIEARGQKIPGALNTRQAARKFVNAGIGSESTAPIVVQPYFRPPTMAELGLQLRPHDAEVMAGFKTKDRHANGANYAVPGNEQQYSVLSRIYAVFVPELGRNKIVGGVWMARPKNAATIHGTSDTLSGRITVEGLEAYRQPDQPIAVG